jgi:hypothetical protein
MGSKSVREGQLYTTKDYGIIEIISVKNQNEVVGRFLDTGYITNTVQAVRFRLGNLVDHIKSKQVKQDHFGYWKVLEEVAPLTQPSGVRKRRLKCQCTCGEVREVTLDSLTRGSSTNCGCIGRANNPLFHGKSSTRLYECWLNMKARSKRRLLDGDKCNVFKKWEGSYKIFEKWALENGYTDEKILLRGTYERPDEGDYKPDNCRWGTKTDNYYDWKLHESLHQ